MNRSHTALVLAKIAAIDNRRLDDARGILDTRQQRRLGRLRCSLVLHHQLLPQLQQLEAAQGGKLIKRHIMLCRPFERRQAAAANKHSTRIAVNPSVPAIEQPARCGSGGSGSCGPCPWRSP